MYWRRWPATLPEEESFVTKFVSVDQYIDSFPLPIQSMLLEIRQSIYEVVPEVEERISYDMPAFELNGRTVIFVAAWKHHISLYPFSSGMIAAMKEASNYKTSGKGTIQFPIAKPLPLAFIKEIVEFRLKETS